MRRRMASGVIATLGIAAAAFFDAAPGQAQASGCEQIQKLLAERQSIVGSLNAAQKAKRKLTPQEACGTLGKLVSNGSAALKFARRQPGLVPDSARRFIDGMKADNEKAAGVRNQACNAVKQQAAMQRRAQQQAQRSRAPIRSAAPMRSPAGRCAFPRARSELGVTPDPVPARAGPGRTRRCPTR